VKKTILHVTELYYTSLYYILELSDLDAIKPNYPPYSVPPTHHLQMPCSPLKKKAERTHVGKSRIGRPEARFETHENNPQREGMI
jgi:hypothetical protein